MKRFKHTIVALIAILTITATQQTSAQSQAGILGVDHIGINVPDLSKAVTFFTDVLGFRPVTQIGPIPLNDAWKTANHMQAGTGPVSIKMVHAGSGANIELFYYEDNKGAQQQPGGDDAGATHIAFYTTDINAAVAYLKSKNVKMLGEPFHTTIGDTAGETWVYFETPWGAKMELVSYPEGKGYEKNHPKELLWSPKTFTNNTTTMDTKDLIAIVEQHLAIWNEKDAAKRSTLAGKVYAENIEMVDRHFTANGYESINEFINKLQKENPSARFTHIKSINAHHNIARLFWQFGPKEKPDAVTGMDLFVIENGKVQKLYVFVDDAK